MTLTEGPFAKMVATVVADDGGDSVEVDIPMFGRTVRTSVLMKKPAEVIPTEPRFAVEPAIDYGALFTMDDVVRLPALIVTSGQLIGFDPTQVESEMFDSDYAPFATTVAPGVYPVSGVVARDDFDAQQICAVQVRFKKAPVVRWRVATPFDVDVARIAGLWNSDVTQPYRYECRGRGGLADARALKAAQRRRRARVQDVLEVTRGAAFGSLQIDDETGANVLVVKAHDGGPCGSWWGEAEDGTIVQLVSDLFRDDHGWLPAHVRRG
jgi:hypothetical protein